MAFRGLTRLFRLAVRPPAVEQEIDAEIAFHLEEEARALVRRGLTPEAARVEAARRFGGVAAFVGGRFLAAMLFGVSSHDPMVFAAVAGVLLAVAVLASLLPAWRAGRADPIRALRTD